MDSVFSTALVAAGPNSQYASELATFGRLIGSWTMDHDMLSESSAEWIHLRQRWTFEWILGGRGIQDVIEPIEADGSLGEPVGTTVRSFDPSMQGWRVNWFSPKYEEYRALIAMPYRDGIRQDGSRADGRPIRWNFSEITDDSFVFDGWCSDDDGVTFWHEQHMRAARER